MTPATSAILGSHPPESFNGSCGRSGDDRGVIELFDALPKLGSREPTVAVLGLGYVGLPTALAIASTSFSVVGVDVNPHRLEAIRKGRVDLIPDDMSRLRDALDESNLKLTDRPADIRSAEAVIICVPTPVDAHLVPDLSYVEAACRTVVDFARRGQTIVLTSTTYVGTTRKLLVDALVARGFTPGRDIFVAFSPERIDPGNPDRPQQSIPRVLGGATTACSLRALAVIGQITPDVYPVSSLEVAEFAKLYENTFRAVNIAFANEMAEMSRVLGLDVMEVIEAASSKPYGFMPFYPGAGVGGHCIPCDPHYLLWQMRARRHQSPLVEQAMSDIASRPHLVVKRAVEVLADYGRSLTGTPIVVVGVSYKPGVEDVRGSPAVEVIEELRRGGADVQYYDPLVPELLLEDGTVLRSLSGPQPGTQALVIVHVVHPRFDAGWLASCPLVLDATYRLTTVPHRAVL